MCLIRRLAVVMVTLGSVSVAQADLIVHEFGGEFDPVAWDCNVILDICGGIGGTAFSGFLVSDLNAPDLDPEDPEVGVYISDGFPYLFGIYLEETDVLLTSNGNRVVFADKFPEDQFLVNAVGSLSPGLRNLRIQMAYPIESFGEFFLNDSMQEVPAIGNAGSSSKLIVDFGVGGPDGSGSANGNITEWRSSTIAVSEPRTLALLGIGLLGMAATCRRKKV